MTTRYMTRTIVVNDSAFELVFRSEAGSDWRWVGTPEFADVLIPYRKDDLYRAIAALILYQLFELYAARNKGFVRLGVRDLEALIEKVCLFVREFESYLADDDNDQNNHLTLTLR